MPIRGIGINAHSPRLDGNLRLLEQDLAYFQTCNFDYVEIPVHGVDVVLNGRLNKARAEAVCRILRQFPFQYTVHSPDILNLFDVERLELHQSVLQASLEFARLIGAESLVYHAGRPVSGQDNEQDLKAIEREVLQKIADDTADWGVMIAVENMMLGSYSATVVPLVEQLKLINRPNVKMALDFGHAYIAATHYGFDYQQAMVMAAPYAVHLHVHDNFGKPISTSNTPYIFRYPYGLGDLHMPPGWGSIPYEELFVQLHLPPAVLIMELEPRYMPEMPTALAKARDLASLVQ